MSKVCKTTRAGARPATGTRYPTSGKVRMFRSLPSEKLYVKTFVVAHTGGCQNLIGLPTAQGEA